MRKGDVKLFRITMFSVIISMLLLLFVFFLRNRSEVDQKPSGFVRTFSKAGAPDQMKQTEIDDFENSKMVSEGSQFGVQYFNEFMHE